MIPNGLNAHDLFAFGRAQRERHLSMLRASTPHAESARDLAEQWLARIPSRDSPLWARLEQQAARTLEANLRLNLVTRRNPELQIQSNLLDGLLLGLVFSAVSRETTPPRLLIDAGSGSGVPGIPARLLLEALGERSYPRLLLVDSNTKKQDFMQRLLEDLRIADTAVFRGRLEAQEFVPFCEQYGREGSWSLCAKAFASLEQTLRWTLPLRKRLREAYLIKGPAIWGELETNDPKSFGWELQCAHRFRGTARETLIVQWAVSE